MNQKEHDKNWLRQAFKVAGLYSQDANTQTGAVIIDPESDRQISFGANRLHFGYPKRYESHGERALSGRPEKYIDLTHAERDAVFSANRKRISLDGKTLYATWTPCVPCAEVMLNNGIKRFVTHESTTRWYHEASKNKDMVNWTKSIDEAVALLEKGGVSYEIITEPIGGVEILFVDIIRAP